MVLELAPGEHRITASDKGKTTLVLNVDQQQPQLVRAQVKRNQRMSLQAVDSDVAVVEAPFVRQIVTALEGEKFSQL